MLYGYVINRVTIYIIHIIHIYIYLTVGTPYRHLFNIAIRGKGVLLLGKKSPLRQTIGIHGDEFQNSKM